MLEKLNQLPGWAFKVKISERAISFWLLEVSSEAKMYRPNHFERFSLILSWLCALAGCHQNSSACSCALPCRQCQCILVVGPPTFQPWSPRGFTWTWTGNEGKPQPVHGALRRASIVQHSLRETSICNHCTSQYDISLVSLASPSQDESICLDRKHNYWILRGADNASNSLWKILGFRNLINDTYWGHD